MAKIPEGLSCAVTPEQIYAHPQIPDGYEFVAFRGARTGEAYLATTTGEVIKVALDEDPSRYGPRIIVRRKPEPRLKPASCPGNPGIMPTPHCDCVDKCCYCHYEKQKNPPADKRYELTLAADALQNSYRSQDNSYLLGRIGKRQIREVKPITRQQLVSMIVRLPEQGKFLFLQEQLRELGIEVED